MVEPIANKTLAQFQAEEDAKGVHFNGSETLEPEVRYALCLLKLAGAVTPDDYAAIGGNIGAVAGVVSIKLLKDRVTQAEVDMPAQPNDGGGNPQVPRERLSYNGKIKVVAVPEP